MVDGDSVASVLEGPSRGDTPFVYVVTSAYRVASSNEDVSEPNDVYQVCYKVPIELLGKYWHPINTGEIRLEELISTAEMVVTQIWKHEWCSKSR